MIRRRLSAGLAMVPVALFLTACDPRPVPGGLAAGETLVSLVATGRAETRPDVAELAVGVETTAPTSEAAARLNAERMARVTAELVKLGIKEGDDLRTQALRLSRIDYGPERGQYRAANILRVRMRDAARAGEAVSAVTAVGGNVVEGPTLTLGDPEAARLSAYTAAVKAARARAEAYAKAADLRVVRIVSIADNGDGGGAGEIAYPNAAPPPPPPPPPVAMPTAALDAAVPQAESGAPFRVGTNRDAVQVRATFALAR